MNNTIAYIVIIFIAILLIFSVSYFLGTQNVVSPATTTIAPIPTTTNTTTEVSTKNLGIGTWYPAIEAPVAGLPQCVTYNQTAYCIIDNNTYYAKITPNSPYGLGQWYRSISYPTSNGTVCFSYNSTAYCLSAGNTTGLAFYSTLSQNGFVGWKQTSPNPAAWGIYSCPTYEGYVYCTGGIYGYNVFSNTSFYAELSNSGIETWKGSTPYPLKNEGELPLCVTYNGYMYCMGGENGNTATNATYFAPIGTYGIGAWNETNPYPLPIEAESCSVDNGQILCVGGFTANNAINTTYHAELTPSGISAWSQSSNYPIPIIASSCFSYANRFYCIGGQTALGRIDKSTCTSYLCIPNVTAPKFTNSIYYAQIKH